MSLWTLSFCIGVGCITLYVTSRALFLSYYSAAELPWVYIGAAAAVLIARSGFTALERRLPQRLLFIGVFVLLTLTLLGFWVWFATGWRPEWASYGAAVWLYVCFYLTNIVFWGLGGLLLDLRQAKRLFGLLGSGELVAACCVGLAAHLLAQALGAPNLLALSAAGFGGAAILTAWASTRIAQTAAKTPERRRSRAAASGASLIKSLGRDHYLLALHLLWGIAAAGLFLADLIYNAQAQARFTDPETLAGFFGLFFAVTSVIALGLRSLFAGAAINAFGPANALLPLPLALGVLALGLLAATFVFSDAPALVFWLALGCKFADYVLRYGLFKPAFMVLYQPLPRQQRVAAQSSVEGLADSAATFAVGLLLLSGALLAANGVWEPLLLLIAALCWLAAIAVMRRRYPEKLMDAVRKKLFSANDVDLDDRRSLSLVAQRLESSRPAEVVYCVELLEKKMPEIMESVLLQNLFHSEPMVRLDALARIERLKLGFPLEAVQDLTREDEPEPDIEVVAAALKAMAAIQENEAHDALVARLDASDPRIRSAALVGLIRYAGIEGVLIAGERLISLHNAPAPEERRLAAEVLAEIGTPSFYRPLLDLLADPDVGVRAAAIQAAARVRNPKLAPGLIANLATPELRSQVSRSLAALGEPVLPLLVAPLEQTLDPAPGSHETGPRVAAAIVAAVARMDGAKATRFLAERVIYPDFNLRLQILDALQARGYRADDNELELFDFLLDEEFRFAAWHTQAAGVAAATPALALLRRALEDEVSTSVSRLLALLSFLFPDARLREAQRGLSHPQAERRAYCLELIDQGLPLVRKKHLLPLIEDIPLSERLRRLQELSPTRPSLGELLINLVERASGAISVWTKATAAHGMGLSPAPAYCAPLAELLRQTQDPLLAETATWALGRCDEEQGANACC